MDKKIAAYTSALRESGRGKSGAGSISYGVRRDLDALRPTVSTEKSLGDSYSRSCTWRKSDYVCRLYIPKGWTVRNVAGVTTVFPPRYRRETTKIFWVTQGLGSYALRLHQGYLIHGYHSEVTDYAKAKKAIDKKRRELVEARSYQRALRLIKNLPSVHLSNVFVSESDSLDAGNCPSGTRQFSSKHGIEGLIRADKLLELEDSSYTRKAIAIAIVNNNKPSKLRYVPFEYSCIRLPREVSA